MPDQDDYRRKAPSNRNNKPDLLTESPLFHFRSNMLDKTKSAKSMHSSIQTIDVNKAVKMVVDAGIRSAALAEAYYKISNKLHGEHSAKQQFCEALEVKFLEWEKNYSEMVDSYKKMKHLNRLLLVRCRIAESRQPYKRSRGVIVRKTRILPVRRYRT